MLRFTFLVLFLFFQSCATSSYSDKQIEDILLLDQALLQANKRLGIQNKSTLRYLQKEAEKKPNYLPLFIKATSIQEQTTALVQSIDTLVNELLEENNLSILNARSTIPPSFNISMLRKKHAQLGPTCVESILQLFEEAPINRGTIFADPAKKDDVLKRIQEAITLVPIIDSIPSGQLLIEVIPMLRRIQTEIRTTEALLLSFLEIQSFSLGSYYDQFDLVDLAPSAVIHLGESYEAQLALVYYSTYSRFKMSIDGKSLNIQNGVGQYKTSPKSTGKKQFTSNVELINPWTGDTLKFSKAHYYHVLE